VGNRGNKNAVSQQGDEERRETETWFTGRHRKVEKSTERQKGKEKGHANWAATSIVKRKLWQDQGDNEAQKREGSWKRMRREALINKDRSGEERVGDEDQQKKKKEVVWWGPRTWRKD